VDYVHEVKLTWRLENVTHLRNTFIFMLTQFLNETGVKHTVRKVFHLCLRVTANEYMGTPLSILQMDNVT
jgi:hypothetical protein